MTTMNVSLTDDQAKFVDAMTGQLGFANRSEFLRALLRRAQVDDGFVKDVRIWPFVSPAVKSRKKILAAISATGHYSEEFLADMKEGLEESDYFDK